jgi:hypothetical protein
MFLVPASRIPNAIALKGRQGPIAIGRHKGLVPLPSETQNLSWRYTLQIYSIGWRISGYVEPIYFGRKGHCQYIADNRYQQHAGYIGGN